MSRYHPIISCIDAPIFPHYLQLCMKELQDSYNWKTRNQPSNEHQEHSVSGMTNPLCREHSKRKTLK